ncbi:MAG: hypothetical protein KME45_03330 [Stenomitos rutilans HA7619-LM2]|jgi:predicted nuclease with TOPRIM domain|nr:hypothetical protein [Stenomitos rutilans HA7619-LM2]MBW4469417.1 hypothetical protein [Stenomitos rutilans HA7619-LM2]
MPLNEPNAALAHDRLTLLEQQLAALAGMHDHLEGRVEALETVVAHLQAYLPQAEQLRLSAEAVDQADISDADAIAAMMGAATIAAQGDKALPDNMISKDV